MKRVHRVIAISCIAPLLLTGCFWNKKKYEVQREKKQYEEIIKIGNKEVNPEVAQQRKDTIIVGVNDFKGVINPIYTIDNNDLWSEALVFEGLLSHDEKGDLISNVAEKWEISEEGKKYSFKIKEGIKFSDGSELTSADVAFTYTALCDPNYNDTYTNHLRKLEGYNEYKNNAAEEVIGIQVDSKYEISFFFTESNSSMLYDFEVGILPKSYYSFEKGQIKKLQELFNRPLGCGAYRLVSYNEGKDIGFQKNEYYWKGTPLINELVITKVPGNEGLQELSKGNIDILRLNANLETVDYLQKLQFINMHMYDNNGYQYIGLNLRNDKFKDKRVRQALLYGLNREKFTSDYYGEFGSSFNIPFAKCSWAYPEDINQYSYDKAKADSLLEETGWTKKEDGYRYNKDNERFTIKWSTYEGNNYVEKLVARVVSDWKEIGVEVVVEKLPFQKLVEKVYDERSFEMYNMSWMLTPDPDPSVIFSVKEDIPGRYNSVGWRNEESERLINEALKENEISKRKEIYDKWGKLANEELPYLYLSQSKEMLAVNMRVSGLSLSPYKNWTEGVHTLSLEDKEK